MNELELMIDVYKDIKLELAAMRGGNYPDSAMNQNQIDGTLVSALYMFETVEPCCVDCMGIKLLTINWHITTNYIGPIVETVIDDSFAMAWVDLIWRAAEKMIGVRIAKPF